LIFNEVRAQPDSAALRFTRQKSVFTTRERSRCILFLMTQREYTWSSIFAWGLTLSGAVLATGGVIGMFWPQLDIGWLCIIAFAGMMAFGIGLVNCSAAGALQAIKHRKPDGGQVDWAVLIPALACCLGFVFATNVGVHLGWEIVTTNAPAGAKLPPTMTIDAVFYIFAFAKPAMAWIVEGRKAMDAEDFALRQAQRRRETTDLAAAGAVRAELLREEAPKSLDSLLFPEPAPHPALEAPEVVETPAAATETFEAEAPKPRAPRTKRKPKTIEEQRAAAMKAAAKRVASFREQHMGRVTDIEHARFEQGLTVQQIAQACDELLRRGESPSFRRAAEILGVAQSRVEKVWPVGVPLDGTGEVRAA